VDGMIVIIDRRQGSYFGLDEVGTTMWESIVETGDLEAAVARIMKTHEVDEVTVRRDAAKFTETLLSKGLLVDSRP
jgi:hypothetical protein